MESTRDFGSREVSGKFFQKLICALVFTPRGITSARMCATYTPYALIISPCPLVVTQGL